ncbi:MAG: hypothetical protein ABI446_00445 [Gemmatimonadaceae bacterium]
MFHLHTRARYITLGALLCAASAAVSACAHTQQPPPSDSASPRGHGGWGRAGDGSHMRHRGGEGGDPMLDGLNLSQDQKSQVTLIRDRYRLKTDSLRMGSAPRDSTSRAQFRQVMTQERGEIRAILTPDQQKQFDDNMEKMKERRMQHDGRSGHDGPPPPNGNGPPPPPAS